ncbi:Anion exchange protein [Aphelenchoides fujianensis]|nr:Anion exchange protein [Aphelenchoides fujianensis]
MTPLLQASFCWTTNLEKKTIGGLFEGVIAAWTECGMLREERAEFVKTFLSAPKVHLSITTGRDTRVPNNSSDEGPNADDADAHLLKKLPLGTESAVVLVGSGIGGFGPAVERLFYPELPDHAVPVRFLFVLLNPRGRDGNSADRPDNVLACLSDEVFHIVAAKATDRFTLADAVDETLGQVLLLPPGQCSENTRLHPKDVQVDADSAIVRPTISLPTH